MKLILSTIFYLLTAINSYSQPISVHLGLQGGASIPILDFSSTNLQKGSFALTGFATSAEAKVIFNNKLGGFIQSGIQLLPVDVGTLGYEKVKADPFLQDLYIRSDPHKVINLVAGPLFQTPVWKSFIFEAQIGAGVFVSSTPYQLYKPSFFFMGPPYYEITPSKDVSFAYSASVKAIYDLTSCYQVALTSQFMNSKASFDFESATRVRTDVRNISLLNNSLSIILKIPVSN
jgi:hypothetical protein